MILLVDNTAGDARATMIARLVDACRRTQRAVLVHPCSAPLDKRTLDASTCVVLSGSNRNANCYDAAGPDDATEAAIRYCGASGRPLLGICYGMHRIARHRGHDVVPLPHRLDMEVDYPDVRGHGHVALRFACSNVVPDLGPDFRVVLASGNHGVVLATDARTTLCAFHPEATPDGVDLLRDWVEAAFREDQIISLSHEEKGDGSDG